MRVFLVLLMVMANLACSSGPEALTHEEAQQRYAELMADFGRLLRQCTPDENWQVMDRQGPFYQASLAVYEASRKLEYAGATQGFYFDRNEWGDVMFTFEEEMSEDVWRAILTEAKTLLDATDHQWWTFRTAAEEVGCLTGR